MTLDDLLDHHAIRMVVERYCRGVDRRDKALLDSVYWPEAIDDHGIYVGKGVDFADYLFPTFAVFEATMHVVAQSSIELAGASAVGDTYFIAGHRMIVDGKPQFLTAWGRYVDRFEKRDGEWRIADRKVVLEHVEHNPDPAEGPFPLASFERGKFDRKDVSYAGRSPVGGAL